MGRGVVAWGDFLGDTTVAAAMLDRLLHRSVVIDLDGDSYRLRDQHARTATLRRTTTGTATRYLDHASEVRNSDEHTRGTSTSALTEVLATSSRPRMWHVAHLHRQMIEFGQRDEFGNVAADVATTEGEEANWKGKSPGGLVRRQLPHLSCP